ncbi:MULTISPECIES: hypothetical protein [Hyphomonas]|uniref:Uncharacterized protein n=1 Tax=Hyphomonas adhaerens TaxID=81029 RepID=A0A3B9H1T3_9PROT|nr:MULTISPECIES: hypothetical protein [Hyphomonas]MBB40981.1 hypothetical protein [Hyphomonas sp.]HAE28224.1 hypothetical protein [Hyphomonas adhaerens]|tara:strand:+ start:1760 stop:1984 length:225 start_codon:yes stop_codon:yes gene_type:complete
MAGGKLGCTVVVSLTLTIEHPSSWGEGATIASVHKSAKSEVLSLLRSELGKTNLKCAIKDDPRVTIVSREGGDD